MSIFLIVCTVVLLFNLFMIVKNNNTLKNHEKINWAIYKYNISQISKGKYNNDVCQDQMEPFRQTLWRLWDWGCKNIVPREVYEKLKLFIK